MLANVGDLVVAASVWLAIIHAVGVIVVAATVPVCLDVLGDANADGHRAHRDGADSRNLAFGRVSM